MSLKYLIAIKIETQNGNSALINGCDSCVDSVSLNSLNTLEIFFCNVNKSHWKLPTFYITHRFLDESKFIWVNLWMTIQIKIELDHNKTKWKVVLLNFNQLNVIFYLKPLIKFGSNLKILQQHKHKESPIIILWHFYYFLHFSSLPQGEFVSHK